MNEEIMKRKNRIKKISVSVLSLVLAVLLAVCGVAFYTTNAKKIVEIEEFYGMGEYVAIDDNFFVDKSEAMNGYSIRINSVKLVNYQEILEANGGNISSDNFSDTYPAPKYTFLVDLNVKNEGNNEGSLPLLNYALYNKSLQIPIDFELFALIDEYYDGWPYMRIPENAEANIIIPFSPMTLDTGTNAAELERRMETESFYFCVSAFPVRKMIEVHL